MNNLKIPYPRQIFVFGPDKSLGEKIAKLLGLNVSGHTTRIFEDKEEIPHQTETVRDRDVYLIFSSLVGDDINNWALNYLRFVWSIKAGHPHKITVVLPKLLHQRQDVENRELRMAQMSSFFPNLLKASGADRIVVCKLHNPASQTIDPPMENLDTKKLIIGKIKEYFSNLDKLAIGATDMGGSKYAREVAEELSKIFNISIPLFIIDKDRDHRNGEIRAINIYVQLNDNVENIEGIIFVDDIISTFGSMGQIPSILQKKYPKIKDFFAIATHLDPLNKTLNNITSSIFKAVFVLDTVPSSDDFKDSIINSGKGFEIIDSARLIARTIDNLHNGQSISSLWINNED